MSREELKKAIAEKGDEAQKEFSSVVIFYDKECYPKVKFLRQIPLNATADAVESQYMAFVEKFHAIREEISAVRFYMSNKKLHEILEEWNRLINAIFAWKHVLAEHTSSQREQNLREMMHAHIVRIKHYNHCINEIVQTRFTEIRAEDPNILSALALIPASRKLFNDLSSGETFDELEDNVKTLKDLECRARKMCESLSARYA